MYDSNRDNEKDIKKETGRTKSRFWCKVIVQQERLMNNPEKDNEKKAGTERQLELEVHFRWRQKMKMKVRSGSPKGKASSSKVNAYFAAPHLHDICS